MGSPCLAAEYRAHNIAASKQSEVNMLLYFVALCLVLLLLWKRYMDGFKKWSHLPQVKPHWFWGNRPMFSKNIKDIELDHYNALEGHRFGILWNLNAACIFIRDIDLIKKIQVSDFEH